MILILRNMVHNIANFYLKNLKSLKLMGMTLARPFCVFGKNQTSDYSIHNNTYYEFSQSHEYFL